MSQNIEKIVNDLSADELEELLLKAKSKINQPKNTSNISSDNTESKKPRKRRRRKKKNNVQNNQLIVPGEKQQGHFRPMQTGHDVDIIDQKTVKKRDSEYTKEVEAQDSIITKKIQEGKLQISPRPGGSTCGEMRCTKCQRQFYGTSAFCKNVDGQEIVLCNNCSMSGRF